jgi:hypothetical protein
MEADRDCWQARSCDYLHCLPAAVPTPASSRGRLSTDIERLLEAFAHREVTLGEIIALMQQRAYSFLLLIVALPFCTPVPLPGLSTPFGLVIAFIGLRIACGLSPWLPERMLRLRLPAKWLPKMFRAVERPVRWIEHFLRPKFSRLVLAPALRRVHGAVICVCGLLLLLPLPIPFTNFFPAVAIVLLACAMLEADGRFSIAGGIFFVVALAYFALLGVGGGAVMQQVGAWWNSVT